LLLGGNQGDAVSVSGFPRHRLLGLRWPVESSIPATGAPDGLFDRALAHVLEMEGGYSDDPFDPGGPTNFGITLADLARDKGVAITPESTQALKAELRAIPRAAVRRIYLQHYWRPSRAPRLPAAIAFMHFDAAVNHGVTSAARMLQRAIGVNIDGEIGPETLGAATRLPAREALTAYAELRRARYRALPHFWRFGRGWLSRVDQTLAAATALVSQPVTPIASNPKETRTMSESNSQPIAADPKWWGHSMTVWGTIVTALSTVLPILAPLFGIDITADLVRALGDGIVRVVEAVGGLSGVIMTIYGRSRASQPLVRRQVTLSL
jgi:lysozyme family protein